MDIANPTCLLDVPKDEIEALLSRAAVYELGSMRRVAVRGEDRFRWLSGMVTNTVSDLAANTGAWNLVLNAQGRIQGDLWVWRDEEQLELEIAAEQQEKLLAHLNHFIIMDDVELVPLDDQTAAGIAGPRAVRMLAKLGLPMPDEQLTQAQGHWNDFEVLVRRQYGVLTAHYEVWIAQAAAKALSETLCEAGVEPVGAAALNALRIAEGIPAYGIDIAERDLPQETSQMRALNFNKGCYLGQEIVERIRSRGNVHRHLRQLELAGPRPVSGTEMFDPEAPGVPAGRITSAEALPFAAGERVFGLGMMRAEAETGEKTFTYCVGTAAGTARILMNPPTLNFESIGTPEL